MFFFIRHRKRGDTISQTFKIWIARKRQVRRITFMSNLCNEGTLLLEVEERSLEKLEGTLFDSLNFLWVGYVRVWGLKSRVSSSNTIPSFGIIRGRKYMRQENAWPFIMVLRTVHLTSFIVQNIVSLTRIPQSEWCKKRTGYALARISGCVTMR